MPPQFRSPFSRGLRLWQEPLDGLMVMTEASKFQFGFNSKVGVGTCGVMPPKLDTLRAIVVHQNSSRGNGTRRGGLKNDPECLVSAPSLAIPARFRRKEKGQRTAPAVKC